MIELAVAAALACVLLAAVVLRPELAVMGLGVFLFVQSALIRLDVIPHEVRDLISRTDEVVLLMLVLRMAVFDLMRRRVSILLPLWMLAAFSVFGAASAIANGVSPMPAALGLYLTLKAGMWTYVGYHLRVDQRTVVLYAHVLGGLFIGAVVVAALQFVGVSLPWAPHTRPLSGEIAATSIFNQHTVFGSALTVAAGLGVLALRLPGERRAGLALLAVSAVGIFLSSVRRVFVSLPAAAAVVVTLLPAEERRALGRQVVRLRRPAVMALVAVGLLAFAVLIGPRLARLAVSAWDQYVVDLASRDRFQLYEGAVRLLSDSPLLGRGPGTYGSYPTVVFGSPAYAEVGVILRDGLKMGAPYASLAGEYGLYGLIAFGAFVILLLRELLPIARGYAGSVVGALAVAGIFMLVDMSIESFVHVTYANSFIAFFVFSGIGAAISMHRAGEGGEPWDHRLVGTAPRVLATGAAVGLIMLLVPAVLVLS
jgi:hypothetical protein